MCTHNVCFEPNIIQINFSPIKFSIFASEENVCILLGQFFVMVYHYSQSYYRNVSVEAVE